MKYALFVGKNYYPGGALSDYFDSFETPEACKEIVDRHREIALKLNESTNDLWAEVVEVDGDSVRPIWRFQDGEWVPTMTIFCTSFIVDLRKRLEPGYLEKELQERKESEERWQKKSAIEKGYKDLFDAIKRDDSEAISKYRAELLALGEQ